MIDYHTYNLSKKEEIAFSFIFLTGLSVCSFLFYRSLIFLLLFPLLYKKGRNIYIRYLIRKRKQILLVEFRDFLFSLSTSLATGRHMSEGLKEAESYLNEIYGNHSLLVGEIRLMIKAVDETGLSVEKVISDFAKRADLEDIYTFSDVFSACRDTGGNLIQAVNKAAAFLSEKINLEEEFQAAVSQRKLEGRVIAFMPFAMILFLQWMSPEYLSVMYTTVSGKLLMSIALALTIVTSILIERMTEIEC